MGYKMLINNELQDDYFKKLSSLKNFLKRRGVKEDEEIVIVKYFTEKEKKTKEQLAIYDKRTVDLYHAVELSESDIELLRVAKILQKELKERRTVKKKDNHYNTAESVKDYRFRTDVLKNCPQRKWSDKLINRLLKKAI